MGHVILIKKERGFFMDFFNIPQAENALKAVYKFGIDTNEKLMALTLDNLMNIKGLGKKKMEAILKIQQCQIKSDLFNDFKNDKGKSYYTPNVEVFFSKNNINEDNILSIKLDELEKNNKLNNKLINSFNGLKRKSLIKKVNYTSSSPIKKEEVVSKLKDNFLNPIRNYLLEEEYVNLSRYIKEELDLLDFTDVDVDMYSELIMDSLEIEKVLQNKIPDISLKILSRYLKKQHREVSFFQLSKGIDKLNLIEKDNLMLLINDLVNSGFVIFTSQGVKYQNPNIREYIDVLGDKADILDKRLKGKTLEEIGEDYQVTRERIRQKERNLKKIIPYKEIFEWKYSEFFKKYELSPEVFCKVFDIGNYEYNFLKMFSNIDKRAKKHTAEELLDSGLLSRKEKESLLEFLNEGYLIIENKKIKKNRVAIINYCIELFAKEEISFNDFYNLVNDFTKQYHLDIDFGNERAMEGIISRASSLLWKYGKKLRYYTIDEDKVIEAIKGISFSNYYNSEISAKKLLDDYPVLMQEIDINDEYELHNLLKKYESILSEEVILKRMPLLEVGSASREEQLLDLLIEMSPVSKEDFALEYSRKYGVSIQTVKANYLKLLVEYEQQDIYNADTPIIEKEVLKNLKGILTEQFYFKKDIYLRYEKRFGKAKFPDYIFNELGYKPFSEFILSNEYNRADYYFEENYFSKDLFEIDDVRLLSTGSFRNLISERVRNLDIFEYDRYKYISMDKITSHTGITKKQILEIVSDITEQMNDKYFSYLMIEHIVENSKLNNLGFDAIFYESILKGVEGLRYQNMGTTTIFRKTKDKFYSYTFLEEIVSKFKSIDIFDLIDYLEDYYGIVWSKEKIISIIEQTSLYYHPVMEMIYQDLDEFYEMMED